MVPPFIKVYLERRSAWLNSDVEPPGSVAVAVKYVNNNPASGIERTRQLCAYPKVAVYKGSGSTNEAANFACRTPKAEKHDDEDDDD